MFSSDKAAEEWLVKARWPDGLRCPRCGGERVGRKGRHPNLPYYCNDCKRPYSVRTDTVMQSSKLSHRKWAVAIYLFVTRPKGISAHQLAKDLGVTVKTAWHLGHRLRGALEDDNFIPLSGPVEVDETFIGGKARNQIGRPRLPKIPVIGMVDGETGRVRAQVITSRNSSDMQGFVHSNTARTATVITDEASGYRGMFRRHQTINRSKGEYGPTNRIESVWSIIKRAYMGTYHKWSPKHLARYATEFAERNSIRPLDTEDRMKTVVIGVGKRLRFKDLARGKRS